MAIGVIACFGTGAQIQNRLHPTVFDPQRWIWKITELSQDEMGYEIVSYVNPEVKALFYYTKEKGNK